MDLDLIRKMLYSARVPVTMISANQVDFELSGEQADVFFQSITRPADKLLKDDYLMLDGMNSIESAKDVLCWIEIKIRSQMESLDIHQDSSWRLLSLLRGALCECLLAEHFQNESIFPYLIKQYDHFYSNLPMEFKNDLSIAYKSKDCRRIVLFLSKVCFHMDGRELLGRFGLKLPEASTEVYPELIRQYQSSTRPTQYWFYNSLEGQALFLVFYTKKCAFAQCAGCNLPQLGDNKSIKATSLIEQMNQVFDYDLLDEEKGKVREIVLSNNGSVFDVKTFSLPALLYFCVRVPIVFPKLKKLIIETRVEYVTVEVIALIRDALAESGRVVQIELAIGVEIFDEVKRNKEFHKGLSNRVLNDFLEMSGKIGISVRCYFMYKALPEMSVADANSDILNAIIALSVMVDKYNATITMHLNPTYVAIETALEKAFKEGRYIPPSLENVRDLLLSLPENKVDIYVGLNDEGLSVDGGSFLENCSEKTLSQLRKYNRTQDPASLKN